MSIIDAVRYRLKVLLNPDEYGRELDEEVEHHLELDTMQQQRQEPGTITDREARSRALKAFGNVTYVTEERRLMSGVAFLDAARQDIQFVMRMLRRRRVFAAVVISTLAVGVAATTCMYSIADVVLFRPLPFPDPSHLVTVWQTRPELKKNPTRAAQWDREGISLPAFRYWRKAQTSFEHVAVWSRTTTLVGEKGGPQEVGVIRASAALLDVLGVTPERGRGFTAVEDAVGGAPVAMVSHEAWLAYKGGDARVIGSQVRINETMYSIIGVLPPALTLSRHGSIPAYWIPAGQDAEGADDPGSYDYSAIARLKRGRSVDEATVETAQIIGASPSSDPEVRGARIATLQAEQTRSVRRPILILLASAALLLIIACANVATILIGEATSRDSELRARLALGATRGRVFRQLLTENFVLALIAGGVGAVLAHYGLEVILRLAPSTIPGLANIRIDMRVLAAILAISTGSGLLFGIVPAILSARSKHGLGLGTGGQSVRGRARSQSALVACEVALSIVLLTGAALLIRSFKSINAVDPGFTAEQLVVARIRLPQPQFSDTVRLRALYRDLVIRARALPAVEEVAVTTAPPFTGSSSSSSFEVEGKPLSHRNADADAQRRITTPGFFTAAGIPIIAGHAYSDADRIDTQPVVVVSHALAEREWPNEGAVGKRIKWMGAWRTVIGVARDIKLRDLGEQAPATVYAPASQLIRTSDPSLLVRMKGNAATNAAGIREIVHDVAPDAFVTRVDDMNDLIAATLSDQRFRTVLITLFGLLASFLTTAGVYGVAATAASRRSREIAIRGALGATSFSITRLVCEAGAKGVATGAFVGILLALAGTRALTPYLFRVRAADPATYAAVIAVLAVTTLAATWIPARRASRIPLVETLRGE